MNIHSWEAFDKGQDMHMQAAPSQAELLYKNFKVAKDKLKTHTKDTIMEKYGNASTEDEIPMELLLGQSERQVEYDRAGRIIKGQVRFMMVYFTNYLLIVWYIVLLCGFVSFLIHDVFVHRRLYCQRANTRKMFSLTITLLFGARGGETINGDIDVASRLFAIVTAQVLLVLRLQRLPLI